MKCPRCQQESPSHAKFCLGCGTPLSDVTVIRRPYADLQAEIDGLRRELGASVEQQTATSDILGVISRSPTDTQPVFDAIAENAARLCSANDAQVLRVDGEVLRLVAAFGAPSMPSVRRLTRGHLVGRAVIDRKAIHVRDLAQALAEYPETTAASYNVQSTLAVPLLREGVALGVIRISRMEVRPFTDKQAALLQTFADQAVIAIENVRLFKELQARNSDLTEALDRQMATSEILRVISLAQLDVQPVFEAIADSAMRLLGASVAAVGRYDGELFSMAAARGGLPGSADAARDRLRAPHRPTSPPEQVVLTKRVHHIVDVETDPSCNSEFRRHAAERGFRSFVAVPMLRSSDALGMIAVSRAQPGGFSRTEIALLQTFADQAVIAIENVRLFTELQTRNRDLTQALDQQTATSEILRVIARSQRDVQPVFEAIVRNAVDLCGASHGGAYRFDGEMIHSVAHAGYTPQQLVQWRSNFPRKVSDAGALGRVIFTQTVYLVRDVELEDERTAGGPEALANLRARGARSALIVPMVRDGKVIGAISLTHRKVNGFSDVQVELLKTFADQAVIAIENVRLFRELESANRDLAAASQHKSEFLANMSHELRTPLNAVIGFSEVLSEGMFGELNQKQEEYARDIHASGQHLLSLINDILDLSKIEAGRMELEITEFHLPTAIENALVLVRERAGRRGIALQTDIDDRLGQIQGDERKLRQVVLNLLSNAIKFTPEGGRIEVTAQAREQAAEVSVRDTGIGIAPEDQEAVFEEFKQVGRSDKKVEGTGLGLTLCRKFIELHGGRIWITSELGAGSTFTFTIPMPTASRAGD